MESEEDDDIYVSSEVVRAPPQDTSGQKPADLEEGEQEDEHEEESDSVG